MSNMSFVLEKNNLCLYIQFHCSILALSLYANSLSLSPLFSLLYFVYPIEISYKATKKNYQKINMIIILVTLKYQSIKFVYFQNYRSFTNGHEYFESLNIVIDPNNYVRKKS